jgi:hypothetical protein
MISETANSRPEHLRSLTARSAPKVAKAESIFGPRNVALPQHKNNAARTTSLRGSLADHAVPAETTICFVPRRRRERHDSAVGGMVEA